jgi:AcrR family transcriptional regulator
MRQIATAVGIAVGGIYNHYGSKDAIFKALIEDRSPYMQIIAIINSISGEDGPAMLNQMLTEAREVMMANRNFLGLVMIDLREFDGSSMRAMISTVLPQLMRFAQRATAAGGIRSDLNLFTLMRTFVMMMIGYLLTDMVIYGHDGVGVPGLSELTDDFWQAAIMDVYLHGVAAPPDQGDGNQQ